MDYVCKFGYSVVIRSDLKYLGFTLHPGEVWPWGAGDDFDRGVRVTEPRGGIPVIPCDFVLNFRGSPVDRL